MIWKNHFSNQKTERSNTHRNLGASAFVGLLALAALPVEAAVIVPNTDMTGGTVTGTLLGIASTNSSGTINNAELSISTSFGYNVGDFGGTRYWQPNGTAPEFEGAINVTTAGAVSTYTFAIPDGSVIHAVYTRWRQQGNQSPSVAYSYSEATNGSVTMNLTAAEVGPDFRWTTNEPVTYGFLPFQTLFSSNFTVNGGDGFKLTVADTNGTDASNVVRLDAVIIDYTIPEPSTALLGGLGFLALLRRRRH